MSLRCLRLLGIVALCLSAETARAQQKTFVLRGASLMLQDATSEVDVFFSAMRFNRISNVWNFEVTLTNHSTLELNGPIVLSIDSFSGTSGPLLADGVDESSKAFYDLSPNIPNANLVPSGRSLPRTLTLGFTGGAPKLVTRVFVRPSATPAALAITRTLDEAGQPLPGAQVVESGPLGVDTNRTDPVFGVITLGQLAGAHTWQFSAPGRLPAWRQQTLTTNSVAVVPSPRLAFRDTNAFSLTPIAGGQITNRDGGLQITFPAGSVLRTTTATLSALTGQTLPAFLPLGWSPLQAFWLELSSEPTTPGTGMLSLLDTLAKGETAALARWNAANLRWEVAQVLSGDGSTRLSVNLPGSGAYVVVVPDALPFSPPIPAPGQPLLASTAGLPDLTNLSAGGKVEPATSPASLVAEQVTATATVAVTNANAALSSGLVLRGEVREQYQLRQAFAGLPPASLGQTRTPPQYESFLVAYQRPALVNTASLTAKFPLRPLLLFGPEELGQATVAMDVLTPTAFAGSVLETNGGLVASQGIGVLAGAGDLLNRQAVQLRVLNPTNFSDFVTNGVSIISAFELTVTGVTPGHHLAAQLGTVPTNSIFVLARVIYNQGLYGLEPIERLGSDSVGRAFSLEPLSGERLNGITGAGQYVLLQVAAGQALVSGIAKNSAGLPVNGLPVQIAGQPWLVFSDSNGSFKMLAPSGSASVTVTDLASGDSGTQTVQVTDPQSPVSTTLAAIATGPRVLSVSPTNTALSVSRVTSMAIAFDKPLNPAALAANGIVLLGGSNAPVTTSVSLDLRGTTVTLLPVNPLAANTLHTISISTNLTDLAGRRLEGPSQFTFTTESDALTRAAAQLTIFEPTNGLARMSGGPGMAEPNGPVILVNESSGVTATVLAKADGSFESAIAAAADDQLSVVIVNANGTRNTVRPSRQIFGDGTVGLFDAGGVVEATTENGPMQFTVDAGAIHARVKYKLQPVSAAQVSAALSDVPLPAEVKLLGGFGLSQEGDDPMSGPHLSFPIDVTKLGLATGARPEDASFVLAIPVQTQDGSIAFDVIDRMYFTNGTLHTFSPPFQASTLKFFIDNLISGKILSTPTKILNLLGLPSLQDVVLHQLMLPMMIAQGTSQTIFGGVFSVQADASGKIVSGSDRPVAGAVVTVTRDDQVTGRPGRLNPGAIFTSSDGRGHYALVVPADKLEQPGFIGAATHPAFPFQRPTVGTVLGSLAAQLRTTSVGAQMDFLFLRTTVPAAGPDTTQPTIRIAVDPRDPLPGTNANEGATITLAGLDDQSLASLDLSIGGFEPLGNPTNPPQPVLEGIVGSQQTLGPAAVQQSYRLTSALRGDVHLVATASDSAGNLREMDTIVTFAGDRLFPVNTNDTVGPRVLFTLPPDGAQGLAPGAPAVVQFSEPVNPALMTNPTPWLSLTHGTLSSVQLSSDERTLSIFFTPASTDPVSFTINSQLTDINTNAFDQDPVQAGAQSHTWSVTVLDPKVQTLANLTFGGGVAVQGQYAFALDRQPGGSQDAGAVSIYDLSGASPTKVGEISLAGPARDLVLIPHYSFKIKPDGPCQTADLLAVVGGTISADSPFQYLRVFNINDPLNPVRVAGSSISLALATVTKVRWAPPWLLYLESGADVTDVGVIDLQTYIIGMNATPDEIAAFPPDGRPGKDANGDGDYCDDDLGDITPLPVQSPTDFFGKAFAVLADPPETNSTRRVLDFDFDPSSGLFGITVSSGAVRDVNGDPTGPTLPPYYRTVATSSALLDPTSATLALPLGMRPKRVAIFGGVQLATTTNTLFRNLAIVSLADTNPPVLGIVDITDPLHPSLLKQVTLTGVGIPQSLQRRDDGLLALATSDDLLLFDPARLLLDPLTPGTLPGLVGTIPGAGSGANSFAAGPDGIDAVNLGSKHEVHFAAPTLRILAFPSRAPMSLNQILALDDEGKYALLAQGAVRTRLLRTRFFDSTTNQSLLPPSTNSHYYVRVDAIGSLGSQLELVLEGLNGAGQPLHAAGTGRPPGRLGSASTLQQLGDTNGPSFVTTLQASRLSDSKGSPLHNIYLAGPISLTGQGFSDAQVSAIEGQLPRTLLSAGRALWIGFDPTQQAPPYPPSILSTVSGQRLVPGAAVYAQVDAPPLPVIFIPGVAGTHLNRVFGSSSLELWPGLDVGKDALSLKPGMATSGIVASDIIRVAPEPYGLVGFLLPDLAVCSFPGIYDPLIHFLTHDMGMVEYDYLKLDKPLRCEDGGPATRAQDRDKMASARTMDGADFSQMDRQPDLFVFPYDWRLGNESAETNLAEYVKVVQAFHPEADQINIVAHSMGGLVARRFILDHPGVVNKLITLGSPWLGAPKAINTMETGEFLDAFQHFAIISKPKLKELAEYFPGPQQLLPSQAYFDVAGPPFIDRAGDLRGNATGSALNFGQFKELMDTIYHPALDVNPVAVADSFHSYAVGSQGAQDNWNNDNTGVQYFHIAAVQSDANTIGKVISQVRIRPSKQDPKHIFELKHEFSVEYTYGDGTVPVFSSFRIGGGQNLNAGNAKLYPLIGASPADDKLTDHNGMLANTNLQQLVQRILQDDIPVPPPLAVPSGVTNYVVHLVNAQSNTIVANSQGLTSSDVEIAHGATDPSAELLESRDGNVPGLEIDTPDTNIVDAVLEGQFDLKATYDGRPMSLRVEEQVDGVPRTVYMWRSLDPSDFPSNAPSTFDALVQIHSPPKVTIVASGNAREIPPDAVSVPDDVPPSIVVAYTNNCTAIQFSLTNEPNPAGIEFYYQPIDPPSPSLSNELFKIDDQNIPGFMEDLEGVASLNGTRRFMIWAQDGTESVAGPVIVDLIKLDLLLGLQGNVPLTDHPEDPANNQLRSPNRYLRRDDEITTRVTGQPNLPTGYYKVQVTSESDANGILTDLAENPPGSGIYENQATIDLGSAPSAAVKVVEEELLFFQVFGATNTPLCRRDVMVDCGEFAGGGIDKFYKFSDRVPSLNGAIVDAGFALAGDAQFSDNVGQQFPTNNPLTAFIANGGSGLAGQGQADVLLVSAHGLTDGRLLDDVGSTILNPTAVFTPGIDKWNQDVEWVILAACNELSDNTNSLGLQRWQQAMAGNPRNVHGLLGANFPVSQNLITPMELFWTRLNRGDTFPVAYKFAMTFGNSDAEPWVATYYAPYANDSLTNLSADLAVPGIVPFRTERFTTLGPTNVTCGRGPGPGVQSSIDLESVPVPAVPLPPRLHLVQAEPFEFLQLPVKERFQHGELRAVELPIPAGPVPNEPATAEAALLVAEGFIETQLPFLRASAVVDSVYSHVTTQTEPNGASASWTNGFLVHYRLYQSGVPVWGDRLAISVEHGRVALAGGVLHMPGATPALANQFAAVTVQAPKAALAKVQSAIEATMRADSLAHIAEAELCYTRSSDLVKTLTDTNEFLLTWRFRADINSPAAIETECEDYWTDAATGELLGHKAR